MVFEFVKRFATAALLLSVANLFSALVDNILLAGANSTTSRIDESAIMTFAGHLI